jgi:hypothetical protein
MMAAARNDQKDGIFGGTSELLIVVITANIQCAQGTQIYNAGHGILLIL